MSGDELVVPLRLHPRRFWLLLTIPLRGATDLQFVLDSGSPVSVIKQAVADELASLGRLTALGGGRYLLRQVSIAGTILPDLELRAGGPAERIEVDGLVGLDYLYQFRRVCVDVPSLRLILTPM